MDFRNFVSKQRIIILALGSLLFVVTLIAAHFIGDKTEIGELFIDLAGSAVTVMLTVLVIDYLRLREDDNRNRDIAEIGEDEVQATCHRIQWIIARLFGYKDNLRAQDQISDLVEAKEYLDKTTISISRFLSEQRFNTSEVKITKRQFREYQEGLSRLQAELKRILQLYEYALPLTLRRDVLALRSELQLSERLLTFIDDSSELNDNNLSLIVVTTHGAYDATRDVLQHESRSSMGDSIETKGGRAI